VKHRRPESGYNDVELLRSGFANVIG